MRALEMSTPERLMSLERNPTFDETPALEDISELFRHFHPKFQRHTVCQSTATAIMRLSGLQRDVLALYRQCLRESRKKPQVSIQLIASRGVTNRGFRMLELISSLLQGQDSFH